jgi:hypothetical protein
MIARNLNVVLGVWLLAAQWLLGYGDTTAKFNEIVVGFAVIVTALFSGCVRPFHHLITAAGAWLIVSPLALSYEGTAPTVNSVLLGLALIAASLLPHHWRYWSHRHPSTHGVDTP